SSPITFREAAGMSARSITRLFTSPLATILCWSAVGLAQQPPPANPPPDDAPAVPKGVEVLARGPVHEAFATLAAEPVAAKPVPKKPPKALDEMPPDEKPEGDVIWMPGYWHYDDERQDFMWVSGVWRTPPPGKRWVAGYWRDEGDGA